MRKSLVAFLLALILSVASVSAMADWGDWLGGTFSLFSSDEDDAYRIGEVAELDHVDMKLINVIVSKGNSYYKPESGRMFVILEFEVKNKGREDVPLSTMMSFNVWCDDQHCDISIDALAVAMMNGKYQLDTVVEPGKTVRGVIGYEVTVDWQKIKVEFSEEMFFGENAIFLIENKEE